MNGSQGYRIFIIMSSRTKIFFLPLCYVVNKLFE